MSTPPLEIAVPEDGHAIVARDVVKTYDTGTVEVQALRGVNLVVPRGELLAIMGPSGCGKTTLLNVLSGIDEMTSGDVRVAGRSLAAMKDNDKTDLRARRMGFIFQAYNLIPVLRAVENVELPLLVAGVRASEARTRALTALKWVGLSSEAHRRPAELSGGQQQRVAIARALVNEPDIVFGDEPTGNLDSETTEEIMSLIRRLNKEKRQTFILVTHDEHVGRQAERVVVMRNGRIEKEFRPTSF